MGSIKQEKQWYIKVKGQKIQVSQDIHKVALQYKDSIRYQAIVEERCGQNNFHYCTGDCSRCGCQLQGILEPIDYDIFDKDLSMADLQSPEELLMIDETWKLIYQFANKATKNGSDIVNLYFRERSSIRQIATQLDLASSTVEYRINRILVELKKNYEKIF